MATPILTLTGIDEKTEPSWINAMARTFKKPSMAPALEFAILRSPKIDASPRYPGRDAIKRITSYVYPENLAFHLCGRYARMVHSMEWSELCDVVDFSLVNRVQVNSTECDEKAMITLQRFSMHIGKPVIMQWRDSVFPFVPGVNLLQDRSGGRGIVETAWFRPSALCAKARAPIGFAGGLSPENAGAALEWMIPNTARNPFWIDCESSLRTNDWFDQNKAYDMAMAVHKAAPGLMTFTPDKAKP